MFNFRLLKNIDFNEACSFLESLSFPDHIDLNKATVLDGELLLETKADKPFLCYWVFDIVCINNRNVSQLSLINRLHLIRSFVIHPLNETTSAGKLVLPFQMRLKPMYYLDQTVFVWKEVSYSHWELSIGCSKSTSWMWWVDFHTNSWSIHFWSMSQIVEVEASGEEFSRFQVTGRDDTSE